MKNGINTDQFHVKTGFLGKGRRNLISISINTETEFHKYKNGRIKIKNKTDQNRNISVRFSTGQRGRHGGCVPCDGENTETSRRRRLALLRCGLPNECVAPCVRAAAHPTAWADSAHGPPCQFLMRCRITYRPAIWIPEDSEVPHLSLCSLQSASVFFSRQISTNQPAVLFSHNKSAPATSHSTANRV